MTAELILSIVSLTLSTATSILTIIINARIGTLTALEAEHKYKKHITKFELSFKDEEWLFNLMESDEFHNYDDRSRRLIHKWWLEYSKTYEPKSLIVNLPDSRVFNSLLIKCPLPEELPVAPIEGSNNENNRE